MMWLWIGIAVLAVTVIGCLLRSAYERKHYSVERYTIRSEKITGSDQIYVFLSDLHDNEFGQGNQDLIREIDQIHPDAVIIGGDMIVSKESCSVTRCLALIKELSQRYPIYYGNGNHESRLNWERERYGTLYDTYRESLASLGVVLLSDSSAVIREDIVIHGIDLDKMYYKKLFRGSLPVSFLEDRLGKVDQQRFHILLAHSPLFFKAYGDWGADLSLAGHFHGGTIRLPILGGVMTPQYQFFLPCCAGSFERNARRMIVSRGLGTHSINIRLNNKPQLLVLELKSPTESL